MGSETLDLWSCYIKYVPIHIINCNILTFKMGGGVWNERGIWNERGCLKKIPLSWQKLVEFEKVVTIEFLNMSGVIVETTVCTSEIWGQASKLV